MCRPVTTSSIRSRILKVKSLGISPREIDGHNIVDPFEDTERFEARPRDNDTGPVTTSSIRSRILKERTAQAFENISGVTTSSIRSRILKARVCIPRRRLS